MTVVDMRNFFTDCKVKLIEISDTKIYYAEEKTEEGHDSLFLLEYDRVTQTERIVANYISVSYTHLDVYKRQNQQSGKNPGKKLASQRFTKTWL